MALLTILHAPDKRLAKKADPVHRVDDSIRQLMDDMLETMYAAPGVGLAAPQVGVSKRVIVLDVSKKEGERNPICLANPEILSASGEVVWEEGCLSVPDFMADVARAATLRVRGLDRQGRTVTFDADELLAVCLQHEIDHLDGVLFIDRISRLKRSIILKKLKKKQEEEA